MKVVVYLPRMGYATGEMPHLRKPPKNYMPGQNLYYLFTACKNLGHQTKVIDGNWSSDPVKEILDFNPDKILISSTTPCFEDALNITEKLSETRYYGEIYIGGPHVNLNTSSREFLLPKSRNIIYTPIKSSFTTFDWVPQVFPEQSIFEVLGLPKDDAQKFILENINDKQILSTDELEPYIFSLFKPEFKWINDTYNPPDIVSTMQGVEIRYSIITSIGCSNSCSFCGNPFIYKINFKSEKVIRDILTEYKLNNINRLSVHDMFFFMSIKHAKMVINLFKEFNMDFSIQTCLENLNEELMDDLADANVKRVLIGIENPFSKTLDKKVDLNKVFRLLDHADKLKLQDCFKLSYIVGLPDISLANDLSLIRHIVTKIKKRNLPLTNLQVNLYTPYRPDPNKIYIKYEDKNPSNKSKNTIFILTKLSYTYWGLLPVGIGSEKDLTIQMTLCDIVYNEIYSEFKVKYLQIREKYLNDLAKSYPDLINNIPSFQESLRTYYESLVV